MTTKKHHYLYGNTIKKTRAIDIIILLFIALLYILTTILISQRWRDDNKLHNHVISVPPYCYSGDEISYENDSAIFDNQEYNKIDKYMKLKCDKNYMFKLPVIVPAILMASKIYGVSPMLIASIIVYESRCNPVAINPDSQAFGLMQIHPVHRPQMFVGDIEHIFKGTSIIKYCASKYIDIRTVLECYGAGEVGLSEKIEKGEYKYPAMENIIRDMERFK